MNYTAGGNPVEKIMRTIIPFVCVLMLPLYLAIPVRAEDAKALTESDVQTSKTAHTAPEAAPKSGPSEVNIDLSIPFFSPLFSGVTVAKVNEESITLKEVRDALTASHEERTEETSAQKVNYASILDRLVNVRLIVQEARGMGIDELPEVTGAVDSYAKRLRKDLLLQMAAKDAKSDPKEVEALYKDMIKEWKIRSVLFFQEDDAKKMLEDIKAGGNFEELAAKAVADKKAKGNEQEEFIKPAYLFPQVVNALAVMTTGSVSPIIKILAGKDNSGYSVVKLMDVRYVDNAEAKEEAEQKSLAEQRARIIQQYMRTLIKKYVKVNKQLLQKLDFEAKKPGIEQLSKDKRVVAVIQGEKPVTVGILTAAIKQSFFHGMKEAAAEKRINEKKYEILGNMLDKALLAREAVNQGMDKTDEYKTMMQQYRDSVIFGTFVEKVIAPDVKLSKDEIEVYYKENINEYSSPEMIRLNSLAFIKKDDAENAMEKLRKGTDYNWLLSNSEGQVKKDAKDLLVFEGNILTIKSLPEGIQKVVSGAKEDEVKLYANPGGYYYVLIIKQVVPPKAETLDTVQQKIAEKLFNRKLRDSVEEYAAKLRTAGDVRIYLTRSK
jgi:hypothetical protein